MTRPAPINSRWRFSLRTLMILLLVAPPTASFAWSYVWYVVEQLTPNDAVGF